MKNQNGVIAINERNEKLNIVKVYNHRLLSFTIL